MPHLRLQVAEEWLREDFQAATGFDAKKLLDHLVKTVSSLRMENHLIEARREELRKANPGQPVNEDAAHLDASGKPIEPPTVPFINLTNLKHAIEPMYYAHVAGDPNKRFLHVTMAAGNDTLGRTAAVRRYVAVTLGDEIDKFVGDTLPMLASVTVHVQDIDRDRGYTTTEGRRKARETAKQKA